MKTNMPFHTISIRIISSYLQIAGLLTRFDLTLPPSVRNLAVVESRSSSLSEQMLQFDCLTDVRQDGDLFMLQQAASVWLVPFLSVVCCASFWFWLFPRCVRRRSISLNPHDGFVCSLMVLFYTLFPSVVNRIALTFSCKTYGDRSLLTEALSVQCFEGEHYVMIFTVGVPGMLIFVFFVPIFLARLLIKQRRAGRLYPSQQKYDARWTFRLGFMFAGYRQGYEWCKCHSGCCCCCCCCYFSLVVGI